MCLARRSLTVAKKSPSSAGGTRTSRGRLTDVSPWDHQNVGFGAWRAAHSGNSVRDSCMRVILQFRCRYSPIMERNQRWCLHLEIESGMTFAAEIRCSLTVSTTLKPFSILTSQKIHPGSFPRSLPTTISSRSKGSVC